jgi:putative oxidoreductase
MLQRLEGRERWAIVILQILVGFVFAMHGSQKLFGAFGGGGIAGTAAFFTKFGIVPGLFWAWVVSITEFVGGLSIMAGFLTRFWAAGLVIDMIVAVIKVNWANGFFGGRGAFGFELPLTFGVMALMLVLTGPSFVSVDRATGLERRRDV